MIRRATDGSNEAPSACRGVMELVLHYIPFFIFTSFYLYTIKPSLLIIIILIFILALVSKLIRAFTFYDFYGKTATLKRKYLYYGECIGSPEYFKETRTSGAFEFFKNRYFRFINIYNKKLWHTEKK